MIITNDQLHNFLINKIAKQKKKSTYNNLRTANKRKKYSEQR